MHRLIRILPIVALLLLHVGASGVTPIAMARDVASASHPLVGAWILDSDVQTDGDPSLYVLFHADGTVLIVNPYFGDGVGVWRPTGDRSAIAIIVFQDLNPDPNQVAPGTLTASLAITNDAAGHAFDTQISSEGYWPDGTLAERDESIGRGMRMEDASFAAGSPVALGPPVSVSQPGPPLTGPGSDDTPYPAAFASKYGPDQGGFWLWEPTTGAGNDATVAPGPFPVILYVDGCCVGDSPNPKSVDPWLTHLARQGYVVIAPVYHATTVLDDVPARLQAALAELARPGHAAVDLNQFAVAGYSFGGVPAVVYAASAAAAGLPVPKALFVMAPCYDGTLAIGATPGSTCRVPPENAVFPTGMKAVELAFGQDFRVGIDMPRLVWSTIASLPATDRNFLVMASDGHGFPPVQALHETPVDAVDAADWYGIWKLSDALFACAFDGKWCEYALGNTPEQRYMGTWSDGTPVVELSIVNT